MRLFVSLNVYRILRQTHLSQFENSNNIGRRFVCCEALKSIVPLLHLCPDRNLETTQ
jgi:hypothetical protein